eukprot:3888229-Ditylum_brightwellii.AAC.1
MPNFPRMDNWQRRGMFRQVSEVRNTRFESLTGAVEGGVHCCAFCDSGVRVEAAECYSRGTRTCQVDTQSAQL